MTRNPAKPRRKPRRQKFRPGLAEIWIMQAQCEKLYAAQLHALGRLDGILTALRRATDPQ